MNVIKYLLFFFFTIFSFVFGTTNIPDKPESWVNDDVGVLSNSEKNVLIEMLNGLEQRSSNQIFIAIFNKLPENYYLEDYAVKLFEKWRPGLEKQDNGILILIFVQDRKIRIEVGYGLEDVVTDAQSGVLIREYLTPEFRKGNYFEGLKSALDILIPAVEGKYKIPVKKQSRRKISFTTILLILVILFILSRFFNKNRPTGIGSKKRGKFTTNPFILGGLGGFKGGSSGGGSFGGGFSGGFGGLSGGGGASGSW